MKKRNLSKLFEIRIKLFFPNDNETIVLNETDVRDYIFQKWKDKYGYCIVSTDKDFMKIKEFDEMIDDHI